MLRNLDKYNIILASNSPRRKELLGGLDLKNSVLEAGNDADDQPNNSNILLDGATVTMKGFGASAPAELLFKKFGFTKENVAETMSNLLK